MQRCPFCDCQNSDEAARCKDCGAPLGKSADVLAKPREAKAAPAMPSGIPPDSPDGRIIQALMEGGKIAAIKIRREQTGEGLKEAKDYVEALAARYHVTPNANGCSTSAALLLVACAAAIILSRWLA